MIEDQLAKYDDKINKEVAKAAKRFGEAFDEAQFRSTNGRVLEHQAKRDALHERFAKKIGLSGARVFLTAENLFLLTNYSGPEPEIVNITEGVDLLSGYPLPRKFTIGLTINF